MTARLESRPWRADDPANPPAIVAYLGRQLARISDQATLDRLEAAERLGRGRTTVLRAVAARRRALGPLADIRPEVRAMPIVQALAAMTPREFSLMCRAYGQMQTRLRVGKEAS